MNDSNLPLTPRANRPAWNKGKLTGPNGPANRLHLRQVAQRLYLSGIQNPHHDRKDRE
jgi:hypothetical protein